MCRIARLFWLQILKGSMSRDAQYFNNIVTRSVINYLFLKEAKVNLRRSARNVREHVQSYNNVKNRWI
jgi:hypothetical protein